jgi:RNA polymerase sigma-70 factor (ECF subfamily)
MKSISCMLLHEKLLIRELQRGNVKAFELLYQQYHARLYNFCLSIIRNKLDAEGMVQDVFIAVWENREKLDESKSFSGFIFSISKNKALNRIKQNLSRKVYLEYMQMENQAQNYMASDIESRELMDYLLKTIQELPDKTKQIFLLSRNEGLTYKQIASKLDVTENVVDHEIRKSLKYIKEKLSDFHLI